jgi:hypothetical protein
MNDSARLDDRTNGPPIVINPQPARPAIPSTPNLNKALAAAQQKCRGASKDSRNNFHGYRYASAEAVITEAKSALADTGLALVPIEQEIAESGGRYQLHRRFLLTHESGECLPLSVSWPAICDRAKPLDKAAGAAATSSLSYLLRDLLLMPRIDDVDDVAARADKPQPAADRATTEQLKKLKEFKDDLGIGADAWRGIIARRGVGSAKELSVTQAEELVSKLAHQVSCKQLADDMKGGDVAPAESKSPD